MATLDDQASDFEERDREAALRFRRAPGPEATGRCLHCDEELFSRDLRWCDAQCRDDWQARERVHGQR